MRRLGILTSGGDAPGMNGAIRAVVRAGIGYGFEVMGIMKGFNGLLNRDILPMDLRSVSDTLHRGGTILQTARSAEFNSPEGVARAADIAREIGFHAIVVVGGDGSFRGARDLAAAGVPVIGIPATIDNDVGCTEYCIGFDTALNTVKEAIDKLRDTATSHEKCSVVEVMGRHAGYIALHIGIANGAEAVLLPESEADMERDLINPIVEGQKRGKKHYIVIVAEGVGTAADIAKIIETNTDLSTRITVLGHIQRGGSPTVHDRVTSSFMGVRAAKLAAGGILNRIIVVGGGRLMDYDINQALKMTKTIDNDMIEMARILSQ